ncbi:MAG: chemotaxis protein CheW [Myxococcota bacterium]
MTLKHQESQLLICGRHRFAVPSANITGSGKLPGVNPERHPQLSIRHQQNRIPATDLRVLFAPEDSNRDDSLIVLVQSKQGPRALIVHAATNAVASEQLAIPETLRSFGLESMNGAIRTDGKLVWSLDIDGEISSEITLKAEDAFEIKPRTVASIENSGKISDGARVVLFPVGGPTPEAERLGLSLQQVPEVRDAVSVTPLPISPPWVEGVAVWQKRMVPVIDLGILCGLGPTPAERFLVIQGTRENEFFIARSGRDVRVLSAQSALEGQGIPQWASAWSYGAYELDDTSFNFLDVGTVSSTWHGGR